MSASRSSQASFPRTKSAMLFLNRDEEAKKGRRTKRSFISGTRKGDMFTQSVRTYPMAWRKGELRTIYTITGDEYTGEWAADLRDGFGIEVRKDGTRYEGEWEADMRSGQGTQWRAVPPVPPETEPSLVVQYSGAWKDDKPRGLGTWYYDNGDIYEGEWMDGRREGWGKLSLADGGVYEGEWRNDREAGAGKFFYVSGNVYDGSWAHGKKDGPGKMFYRAANQLYHGEWLEGAAKCGIMIDLLPGEEVQFLEAREAAQSTSIKYQNVAAGTDTFTPSKSGEGTEKRRELAPSQGLREEEDGLHDAETAHVVEALRTQRKPIPFLEMTSTTVVEMMQSSETDAARLRKVMAEERQARARALRELRAKEREATEAENNRIGGKNNLRTSEYDEWVVVCKGEPLPPIVK